METAFFACATTHPFSIISSHGVRNILQVRTPNPEYSGFLKRLPVIPKDIINGAEIMIAILRSRGMIKEITFVDVLNELRSHPLSETETVACLNWWTRVVKHGLALMTIGVTLWDTDKRLEERSQLLDVLVVSVTGPPEKIIRLSDAQTFLNHSTNAVIIPTDGPLPSTLVPTSITSSFDPDVLASVFPWKQLSIVDWLLHVIDPKVAVANAEFDITQCGRWAERVLSVLAQAWPSLAETAREIVIWRLSRMSCIPTSTGLKLPHQAYFSGVKSFRDLPIVTMPSGAIAVDNLELVLQSLGVRKHEELNFILDRSASSFPGVRLAKSAHQDG